MFRLGWGGALAAVATLAVAGWAGEKVVLGQTGTTAPAEPKIDPQAADAMKRMEGYLRSLDSFSIDASVTRDRIVHDDFKVQGTNHVKLDVRRPDKLRADISGDDGETVIYYDGKTMTVYTPSKNYYAVSPAPPTILQLIDDSVAKHGIELPLTDLIYVAMGGDLGSHVTAAGNIGPSKIGGADVEQFAFRGAKLDWQVWLQEGDQPLPRKLVLTTRGVTTEPQYSATLNWDTSPKLDDKSFIFTPPNGAQRIDFAETVMVRKPTHRRSWSSIAVAGLSLALSFASASAEAQRRGGGANVDRGNVDRANVNRTNVNNNVARSSVHNENVNVNVNRNVNVHGGYGYGYGYDSWGHPIATAAAVTATAVAVGTMVAALPPHCSAISVGAATYQNCGGTYYQPVQQGTSVQYVVVNPPQ